MVSYTIFMTSSRRFSFFILFFHLGLHPILRGIPILLQTFLPSLKVFSFFFFLLNLYPTLREILILLYTFLLSL